MRSGVKIKVDKLREISKAVAQAPGTQVLVGVPSNTSRRDDDGPITSADLGYIHEFGAPEANIPARPFLYPGIREAKSKVTRYLKQGALAAMDRDFEKMGRALGAAGQVAASSVQRHITEGPFVPLAAGTLAARRRRGRTGTRPLIDTGQLRRSITWVVRKVAIARFTGKVVS